jgi:hypothetical protein
MKKFYISIFAAFFLLTSLVSEAQVYNSIASNPSNYTLDDARFWVGGVAPPNPCTGCAINIYSSVSMVMNGSSSDPTYNPPLCTAPCNYLNDVVLNGGTINVYGNNVILTINTYLELFNTTVTIGNNPTDVESIKINGQIDLNGTASVQLANDFTEVDATDQGVLAVPGPHTEIGNPGAVEPGIYAIIPPDPNGYTYTQTLEINVIGSSTQPYSAFAGGVQYYHYLLNCSPGVAGSPNSCADGLIFGPAITTANVTYGVIFTESTTLPVVLEQFIANKQDDGSVKLSWSTSQEVNSDYYEIDRSSDQTDWAPLGTVKAKGYSSITSDYSFIDKTPVNGTGYYRLKMVDLDGKYVFSKTVSITSSSNDQALVIYSNPFSDQIRMKINVSRSQNLIMTVSDMVGKTLVAQSYNAQAGDNFVNLQPKGVSSGMYVLHIHGDSYDQTVKIAKQ